MNSVFRVAVRQFSSSQLKRSNNVPAGKIVLATFYLYYIYSLFLLPGYARVKETQKKFAIDDGNSVTFKGGMTDKLLYHACHALILVGAVLWVENFVTLAWPPKKQD